MLWKRWLKRVVGAVVLVLVVRTVWLIGEREWRRAAGEKELAAAVAETEATDPDWRWEALSAKRRKPPAGKNGAEVIARIKNLVPKDADQLGNAKLWETPSSASPNARLSEADIGEVRQRVDTMRPAVELARTLRDFPEGNRELETTPDVWNTKLGDTEFTRRVSILLSWDVVLAIEDSDPARAADGLLAMLNTSRSIGDEPFLISQLIRIATRTIATRSLEWVVGQTELTPDRLAAVQDAWATDAEEPLLLYGLRGERALNDVCLSNLADGTVTPSSFNGVRDFGISFEGYAWWLYRGRIAMDRAHYHRYMTRAVEVARLPTHEQPVASRSLPPPPDEGLRIANLFLPAVEKVSTASWRSTAEARCTVVGIACERFRINHGRWPEELAEMPADILPGSVPLDPFDGQPLRYRRLDDGVVVYSIGQDGTDDRGNLLRSGPVSPGTDTGFRLWNPDQRRKLAPPPKEPDKP
jgi:hypothetical protein